jgi:class 3 adenylate cyclase
MNVEDFFNRRTIVELSFFNFRNAITACYFADAELRIQQVNENFRKFFPVLGNVTNARLPDVLEQLGVAGEQIDGFTHDLEAQGHVLIPEVHINVEGNDRVFSLLSTKTTDRNFAYLNGVQGQFVDRTAEWDLRQEREALVEQKLRDREIIEEKSRQLEELATRLAKYLSPQIYQSIFSDTGGSSSGYSRKHLTVFMSDIVRFTDLSDTLDPERLAKIINSYLSEMASIAIDCGGTIDKFIGDAVLVFFGDPESRGDVEDATACLEMAMRMRQRIAELQKYWHKLGAPEALEVRMGIASGYCTVGNFGSEQRLDYTVLGGPVNLASRLQELAAPDTVLIDEPTQSLVVDEVECAEKDTITPRGFARPVRIFEAREFRSDDHRAARRRLSHTGERVEVNVIDSSDIRAAIEELRRIQEEFEQRFAAE